MAAVGSKYGLHTQKVQICGSPVQAARGAIASEGVEHVPFEKDMELGAIAQDIPSGSLPIHLGQQQNTTQTEAPTDQGVELAIKEEIATSAAPRKGGV